MCGQLIGNDVHAREHAVEAVPIGRLQLLLDARRSRMAIVIMDLQPESAGALCKRMPDAAHADNAEALA